MAFTNLTELTQEEYQRLNISAFRTSPAKSESGSPDTSLSVNLSGWVSDTVLAFTVTINDESGLEATVDGKLSNTVDLNLIACGDCEPTTYYYTIDVGADDSRNTNWQASFQVQNQSSNTGTWVFRKGVVLDDDY